MIDKDEALRLADALDALLGYRGINADVGKAATMLRSQHARIAELEAVARVAQASLTDAKFLLDIVAGMAGRPVPEDADGPIVTVPAAIEALRKTLGGA